MSCHKPAPLKNSSQLISNLIGSTRRIALANCSGTVFLGALLFRELPFTKPK